MPFSFPDVSEIPLLQSPLREVICQVRFPEILRISADPPTQVQEHLRGAFPELREENELLVEFQAQAQAAAPPQLRSQRIYRFLTEDGASAVGLGQSFFSLSTSSYSGWLSFRQRLFEVVGIINDVYSLPYATRIGLRYINHLDTEPEDEGLETLLRLVHSDVAASFLPQVVTDPLVARSEVRAEQPDGTAITIRFSLAKTDDGKPRLVLDFDCYTQERTGIGQLEERVEVFHNTIHRAFRWATTERLLERYGVHQGMM